MQRNKKVVVYSQEKKELIVTVQEEGRALDLLDKDLKNRRL